MRGAVAAACLCLLLTGCASAQAEQPREPRIALEANEARYEPPIMPEPIEVTTEAETGPQIAPETPEAEPAEDYGEWEPTYWEPASYDEPTCLEPTSEPEPTFWEPAGAWQATEDAADFMAAGIVNDGVNTFTWYSENVLPGGGLDALNANGRTVDGDGFVVDGDGYIALATPYGDGFGTVVETPWGLGKVYDTNPGGVGYDVYTSW